MDAIKPETPRRPSRENPLPPHERIAVPIQTAADLLSCSRRHIYELISSGQLHTVKVGTRRLVPRSELERLAVEGTAE